jgi:uncharacterized protein YyaL (SSP411 family)
MNQLQNQVSPYLLQHKDNPVHWLPWGNEALELARKQDKPIILSIGYAACHWCHVMEHESFEDTQVADLMNAHFICIKVDREERPDIDLIYMDAIHQMGLAGGWPLNVFLMPDQKPFYGGTYFPKSNWMQVCNSINHAFRDHRSELQTSADGFSQQLSDASLGLYPLNLDTLAPIIPQSIAKMLPNLDPVFGGIHKAPKFPLPVLSLFYECLPTQLANNVGMYEHADRQLTKMAQGGIFDQIGGGFSRYSVDSEWFCPHFEKMLYDNAQLIQVYSKAFKRTNNELYKEVIYSTIDFLEAELKDSSGLYFASLDADSEGKEGQFYVWSYAELNALLPYEQHAAFYQTYQLKVKGNWEEGKNILFKKTATCNAVYKEELAKLTLVRKERIRPQTDTKLLLSWNALAGMGLLQAGIDCQEPKFISLALDLGKVMQQFRPLTSNKLLHQIAFANQPIYAFLDDSATYGLFLVHLYLYTSDKIHLNQMNLILDEIMNYHDQQNGLFSFQSKLNPSLIANKYEVTDSVMPSSNSILCEVFLWAGILVNDVRYTLLAKEMMACILEQAQANPLYHANWLRIYSEWFENPQAMVKVNVKQFTLDTLPPINAKWIPVHDQSEAFMVCIGNRCLMPCQDLATLSEQLASI